jgi:hypothetical protein
MSYFGDMAQAVEDYPASGALHLVFTDVQRQTGSPGAVNVNETWKFRVQITNFGPLDMNSVVLHLHGDNGAKVGASATGPWEDTITTAAVSVKGGTGEYTGFYYFKAPATQSNGVVKDLVSAHVNEWTASLTSILVNSSKNATAPAGTYSAEVHP